MVFRSFFDRQLRTLEPENRGSAVLDGVIEEVTCIRTDEHQIEGQEYGDLIPPLACHFSKVHPYLLAVTDEDGGVLILNTLKTGLHAIQNDWRAHENAVFDADWMPGEDKLLTASGDQTILMWDVAAEEKIAAFRGHTSSVKTVRFRRNDPFVFATGSRDGHIMVWDRRISDKEGCIPAVNVIHNGHISTAPGSASKKRRKNASTILDSQQSVTAVVFQDEHTLLSAGTVDGSVKMWDLRKNYSSRKTQPIPKHCFDYAGTSTRKHGFSSLVLDSTGTRLFASCMDNIIYQYNCASLCKMPVASYRGHLNSSFYVKTALSPDDLYLLSGSSDSGAYIWKVDEPVSGPFTLNGHTGEVSAVAWCHNDLTKMATISDDSTVRIWRLNRDGKPPPMGHVVGSCEKTRREVGVSVSTSDVKQLSAPNTPKASKLPFTTYSTVVTLARNGENSTSNSSKSSTKLVSSSITKWLESKTNLLTQLTMKTNPASPRKLHLVLSPKKRNPQLSTIHEEFKGKQNKQTPPNSASRTTRIKRKLIDTSDDSGESKAKRRCSLAFTQDENSQSPKKIPISPVKNGKEEQVLSSASNLENTPRKKIGESGMCLTNTPIKDISSEKDLSVWQSPTMNLPNYVLNPQPRTPVAPHRTDSLKENAAERTPDWLTQLRLERQDLSGDSSPSSKLKSAALNSPTTPKMSRKLKNTPRRMSTHDSSPVSRKMRSTPRSLSIEGSSPVSRKKRNAVEMSSPTPKTSTGEMASPVSTPKRRKSILNYFSPHGK